MSALADLAAALRAEGGLLAAATTDPAGAEPLLVRPENALLAEAVREGYLQHYATGRVIDGSDPDLALLAGDRLYALGLARLAERGDLEAIAVLAELIARCAAAHAEGHPDDAAAAWAWATERL